MSLLRKLLHKTVTSFSVKPIPKKLTNAQYDALINYAGQSRNFDALHGLLNQRVTDGHSNTKKTFRFITGTDASLSILDDLTETLARLNQGPTRKNAFDLLIVRLCELNRIDESLRVVDKMARRGFGFNTCTFQLMLESLISNEAVEEAWRVVGLMEELGVWLDLTAYNLFLFWYCAAGDLAAAAGLLVKMEEEGVKCDARTHDALVLGACKAGKVEVAMVLLRRMMDDGVGVLASTHVYVVDALVKMGCWEQAIEYVRSFCGKEKALDTQNFNRLAKALVELKRFKEARRVLDEMERRGIAMPYKLQKMHKMIDSKV